MKRRFSKCASWVSGRLRPERSETSRLEPQPRLGPARPNGTSAFIPTLAVVACSSTGSEQEAAPACVILPQELIEIIIAHLHADANALRSCACTHSAWTRTAQMHLFDTVEIASTKALYLLVETLQHSPHIVPLIKGVVLRGKNSASDASQSLNVAIQDTEHFTPLSTLLPDLHSIEFKEFLLGHYCCALASTHFLGVARLKLQNTRCCRPRAFIHYFLAPRPNLTSLSFSGVDMDPSPVHIPITKYREVEINEGSDTVVLQLLRAFADGAHEQSQVKRLTILLPDSDSGLPDLCKALRVVGPSLHTLKINNRMYWREDHDMLPELLQHTSGLRHLEWTARTTPSYFNAINTTLTPVLAHIASRLLESITLHLTVIDVHETRVPPDWTQLAEVLNGDAFSGLKLFKICITIWVAWSAGSPANPWPVALFDHIFPRLRARKVLLLEVRSPMS